MSTAWLSTNGLKPRTISSFSPVSSGTRVERRSAIQASENGGFSASSMNSGFIGSTALATAMALGVSSSLWQCTAISISSPTASRQLP